ncbi:MAG: cytochrome C oxidase subunit IV family protein [Bdellovibrionota bacterium]|nr:MAG: cytochrome C oxidase subunit IV family protein [Bdellovibrionota bacterium]
MSAHHHDSHSGHGEGFHGELGHVVPYKTYLAILIWLLILTVVTVAAAQVDFGAMNAVVAMIIASIKALLVATIFMHLKFENPVTWLYALFPIVLLAILLAGLFIDNPFRTDPQHATEAAQHAANRLAVILRIG